MTRQPQHPVRGRVLRPEVEYQPVRPAGVDGVPVAAGEVYRVHLREPSFVNVQSLPALTEGGPLSDVIASVASVDSVMGGCDR